MTEEELQEFEKHLDAIREILQKNFPTQNQKVVQLIGLFITLPQSLKRIERALWEKGRARHDLFSILDLITERIGVLSDEITDKDFNSICDKSSKINIQMSRLVGELENRGNP